jgi:hypothetical protein
MGEDGAAPALRRGLLWLGALTSAGIAMELAADRHWTQPIQLVAWVAVALVVAALAVVAWLPTRRAIRLAQILAVLVMLGALWGIYEHVAANYEAAPLDFSYSNTWDTLPELTRWWLALSKTVGPSPPLAPAALAQAGLCVLLASMRHPALRSSPSD